MKSSLAAMIVAANIFLQKKPTFQGSIAFLITSGEEGDDFDDGTPYVMQKLAETGQIPRYCIVGEPSCEKVLGDTIKIGRRGSLTGQLKILGKQGHVAYPQLAENPIHHSSAFFNELVNIKWEEEGFQGVNKNETYSFLKDVKTLDKASAEGRTPAPERQNRSHFYSHPFFPPTSFQITQYIADSGGSNVIPGELNVGFNFRYSPVVSHEQLQQKVEALLKKHNLQYSITWRLNGLPFLTEKGPLVETAQRVIKEVCHIAPVLSTSGGTSDGRFIAPYGVDVIELGLINKTIHQINESTSIEALHQLCKVYEKVLEALL
jgi:succinyl-diaminopimelate desuccinylase